MFHQVCRAIEPALPLQSVLQRWPTLAEGLAEAPRKRKLKRFHRKTS
jgi:hypothetical protein